MASKEKSNNKITEDGWRITKVVHQKNRTMVRMEQKSSYRGDSSAELPNPEFLKALATLGNKMADHIKLQPDWKANARHQGVSIDYSDEEHEQMGMVFTMYIPLTHMNGGFPINTPRLVEKTPGARGGTYMSEGILNATKTLLREAMKYYEGDRAQQDLIDKIKKEDEEESEKKKSAALKH